MNDCFLFREVRVVIEHQVSFLAELQLKTVFIRVGANVGAGLILENGIILTSLFVVGNEILARIIFLDETETDGSVVLVDEKAKLAAIEPFKRPDNLLPVEFGLPRGIGEKLFVVNHSQANWAISEGNMLYRLKMPERRSDEIVVDGHHPMGFNGGGVYDENGRVVGVSLGTRPGTFNMFATPAEPLAEFAQKTSTL